ncbi:MAG: transglycosylase SLT domain-containing protein [Methylococcaceae bacterium]|nr:transglycosylase SLT domain-containing protein [Methylococcaceae bacterium]
MDRKKLFFAASLLLPHPPVEAVQIDPEPEGIRKMALVYEHGRGVEQDFNQAYRLYCKAALMGDAVSAYNIGFMFFNGRGLPRHHGKALYWYRKAAEVGDGFSRKLVARFRDIAATDDPACQPEPPPPPSLKIREVSNPNREIVAGWVKQIAPYYSIDPALVMAVIQAESAFNPGALSPKNAQGLMQLIPATAERFGVKDPWNPVENIKGGVAYLNWLLRRFSGNVEWVLAAYNAGEGAVDRHQGVPPYGETQAYVKKILAHYPKTAHPIPPEPTPKEESAG